MNSRPKKSLSSKGRAKVGRAVSSPPMLLAKPARRGRDTAPYRKQFRAWRESLPTQLERDTLLMPEAIAECVVQEASQYLRAELPPDFAERLAAKAYHLYPRHRHFHEVLNRSGNRGRDNLYVYMRHWTCGWLKRERYSLYRRLPWEYALGRALPALAEKKS